MLKILRASEYGQVFLSPGDLTVDGSIRMRQDVIRHGYVEWRSSVGRSSPRDDPREVTVDRSLYARGVVGLVPLAKNIAVMVEPRFPSSVTHMVNVCEWPTTALNILRYYDGDTQFSAEDWMLDRIATDFLMALEKVVDQGLSRNYALANEVGSSPHGRINIGRSLKSHFSRGVDYRISYSYFKRSEDNPVNQCLLEALHWSRFWFEKRSKPMRKHLKVVTRYLHAFRYVTRDRDHHFLSDSHVRGQLAMPRTRSAYDHALSLAVSLLERRGFSLDGQVGTMGLKSLILETDELFEEFIRRRIRHNFVDSRVHVLDGNNLNPVRKLFESTSPPAGFSSSVNIIPAGANKIQPDIILEEEGAARLVIDVKYQKVKGHADRSALEQCVTYGVRLGCKEVMSVHPCASASEDSGLFLSGKVGDMRIWQYRINLSNNMDIEMGVMSERIKELINTTAGA